MESLWGGVQQPVGKGRIRFEGHRLQTKDRGNRWDYKWSVIQMNVINRRESRWLILITKTVVALTGRNGGLIR